MGCDVDDGRNMGVRCYCLAGFPYVRSDGRLVPELRRGGIGPGVSHCWTTLRYCPNASSLAEVLSGVLCCSLLLAWCDAWSWMIEAWCLCWSGMPLWNECTLLSFWDGVDAVIWCEWLKPGCEGNIPRELKGGLSWDGGSYRMTSRCSLNWKEGDASGKHVYPVLKWQNKWKWGTDSESGRDDFLLEEVIRTSALNEVSRDAWDWEALGKEITEPMWVLTEGSVLWRPGELDRPASYGELGWSWVTLVGWRSCW